MGEYMGKVILCTGERAVNPFVFNKSDVSIYTMDELCYFVYHNIEIISEELYSEELILFIRKELGLHERADFIKKLSKSKAGIKDIAVSILCSTDYFTEKEIKDLIAEMDMLSKLKPIQRQKRSADQLMRRGDYIKAAREYLLILNSGEPLGLTYTEHGDIIHNLAVADAAAGAFEAAAEGFLKAYEHNHNRESLKQYLFALKISKQDVLYEKELDKYVRARSIISEIESEYKNAFESFLLNEGNDKLLNIISLREDGKLAEYNVRVKDITEEFKTAERNLYTS